MRECAQLLILVSLWTGYQADVGPLSMKIAIKPMSVRYRCSEWDNNKNNEK